MSTRFRVALLAAAAAALVGLAWWISGIWSPTPPRSLTMATGPDGSACAVIAPRYREHLARVGVDLRLRGTAGALENLALLRDPGSGVSVGFLQAGTASAAEAPDLVSLGTVLYEPLWLFHRASGRELVLADLRGGRLAVGPEGSGTRALALRLLALAGIDGNSAELLPLPPEEAADSLLRGDVDLAAIDLPLADGARQFYKTGRPFLQRHLPFWLAALTERLLIILVPLIGVLYPLARSVPGMYAWNVRRRIFKLYRDLKVIEMAANAPSRAVATGDLVARLDDLEQRASRLRVPRFQAWLAYTLRHHIRLVRELVERRP